MITDPTLGRTGTLATSVVYPVQFDADPNFTFRFDPDPTFFSQFNPGSLDTY